MLICGSVISVSSAEKSGVYEYRLLLDGTAEITAYSGDAEDLAIPGMLDGKPVSILGNMAFAFNNSLTYVTVPDSVICIDDEAFVACRNLISVSIPDSVKRIGDGAFRECSRLTTLMIPESVIRI